MTKQRLQVLIVAQDRALIRQLSVFLEVAGYAPETACDAPLALAALESDRPDVVIAEWDLALRDGRALCRAVSRQSELRYSYLILLVEERMSRSSNSREMLHSLEAGADDFLAKPLVYGEVLARLNAAAEEIRFERSWGEEARFDPTSGLPTRATLLGRLRRELALSEADGTPVACLVLEIDFFRRIADEHGRRTGEAVLQSVVECLTSACGDSMLLARLGHERFGAMLPQATDAEAAAWAEDFRNSVADLELPLGDARGSLTASVGVAASRSRERDAEGLLARATQALESAKISGRNVVVRDGEFDEEAHALTGSVPPSKLFHRAVARDVMTPCPLTLRYDECVGEAAAMLPASGPGALPVVDGEGRVVGLVERDELLDQPDLMEGYSARPLGDLVNDDCVRLPESTSFETLIDFFARDNSVGSIVIEKGGRPAGLVTRRSLRELAAINR